MIPEFPVFKPLELADRRIIQDSFSNYQPETSELNFTNLFIWRECYKPMWCFHDKNLLLVSEPPGAQPYAFSPIGISQRSRVVLDMMNWLRENREVSRPRIERTDKRLAHELGQSPMFTIEPQREHFDYLYLREELINLSGNKYHSKKNHMNAFRRNYEFEYRPLTQELLPLCKEMASAWCILRHCEDDMSLTGEWEAVNEALEHFGELHLVGGAILISGKVEAFSIGERLNPETVVVHVEKANPEIRGLYAAINQQCCEKAWGKVTYINREQDLGNEGLRQAKLSYHPVRLVEKFRIALA